MARVNVAGGNRKASGERRLLCFLWDGFGKGRGEGRALSLCARHGHVLTLKSSKAPTNYFTPNILRKSWSRLVVSVVHLDTLAFPVAAT